jgi:hypothetical protein
MAEQVPCMREKRNACKISVENLMEEFTSKHVLFYTYNYSY